MYAVFKRELFSLLNSLMAYITIGVFLLVLGLLLWYFPDTSILEYGYAELNGFFSLCPFLFIWLIPAMTMRSFAEERREGTYILLATRPLSDWQIVLGKYFAALALMVAAVLPTLLYYYTLVRLGLPEGNIDGGAVAGSYFGLLLLGAAFTAMGIFCSSLTRNQVVAFAFAALFSFFAYSGFDALAKLFSGEPAESVFNWLSIHMHFESMGRGVLDTRDLIYFLTFILLFLGLTRLVIGERKW